LTHKKKSNNWPNALITVTDKGQNEPALEERSAEVRVDALARTLAHTINSFPTEQREQLREMVVHTVRDEVRLVQPPVDQVAGRAGAGFNPFAIGLPLLGAAVVMGILFPPVGLFLFAVALFMMLWGLASVVLSRR
jgi:hypothetical protein